MGDMRPGILAIFNFPNGEEPLNRRLWVQPERRDHVLVDGIMYEVISVVLDMSRDRISPQLIVELDEV